MVLYGILVALSAVIVGVYAVWNLTVRPPEIPQEPDPAPPAGSGSQAAEPVEQEQPAGRQRREDVYNFVLLGRDRESANTDTIIVVSYDVANQKVGMISIPRDTAVNRDWRKDPKINGAYAGAGVDVLKEEIEQTFGIPIDYYIYVDLKGFVALVDELEGVDVYIPEEMNYDDPYQDLHIHYTKGQHHLNGQQAMEVVRFRHNNDGSGYTDVGRAEMQRQVLVALAKKVVSWELPDQGAGVRGDLPGVCQDRPVHHRHALLRQPGSGSGPGYRHHPGHSEGPGRGRGPGIQILLCLPGGGHPAHPERAGQPLRPAADRGGSGSAPGGVLLERHCHRLKREHRALRPRAEEARCFLLRRSARQGALLTPGRERCIGGC